MKRRRKILPPFQSHMVGSKLERGWGGWMDGWMGKGGWMNGKSEAMRRSSQEVDVCYNIMRCMYACMCVYMYVCIKALSLSPCVYVECVVERGVHSFFGFVCCDG